ncbi:hypothetical protein [Tropicimonas sp. IMCC34043]|uniref:hypothetical protein n=1 Tax=Tropicimonas sp. IMCC34043 TaxID=2248760 RepID=UPI0013002124|nr:hypothetical protein [Tropicimonas sp. IMCC34043]
MAFVLHADGRMSGRIGGGDLTGTWYWSEGFFCRTAQRDGEDLGLDCEAIEVLGDRIRYTSDKGTGDASIVRVI